MVKVKYNLKRVSKIAPALFLHIQKTAGTSIVKMAAAHYGNANCSSHGDFSGKLPEEFFSTQFVSGHFGYDYAKALMPERYCFTFLRDPAERILSLYYFYCANNPDTFPMYRVAHENKLTDFLRLGLKDPMVRSRIWNNQVWQLACGWENPSNKGIGSFSPSELLYLAKKHLDDFSYVGFTENFDDDMVEITRSIGMMLPEVQVHSNCTSRPTYNELNGEDRALLAELTKLDQELYDYAKQQTGTFVTSRG